MSNLFECSFSDAVLMADLHARAFAKHETWSTEAITELLAQPTNRAFGLGEPLRAFILIQHLAPEAEILTLATAPEARRQGFAGALISTVTETLKIQKWLLDVAADNIAALALYDRLGFRRDGVRANYYRRPDGQSVDAVLMSLRLGGHG